MAFRKYPGQVVSHVGTGLNVNPQEIYEMARKTGQYKARSEFLEAQAKAEAARQRAQQAADRERFAAEVRDAKSNDPEDEGFWNKLGQMAGSGWENFKDGASATIDVLSRFNYASANAVKTFADIDEDKHDSPGLWGSVFGVNPGHVFDDFELSDVGEIFKAGWRGFKNDGEKTTFADVIENQSKKYSDAEYLSNSWYQGGVGFVGDVLLDPTTYIGVGLVTKPLKKAAAKAVDDDLVDDLAKLELKGKTADGEDFILQADDFRSILGDTRSYGNYVPEGLSRKERRAFIKGNTLKGRRAYISKSSRVAETRIRMENISKVLDEIKDVKSLKLANDAEVEKLNKLSAQAAEEYKKAVENFGSKTFKEALEKASKLTPAPKAEVPIVSPVTAAAPSVGKAVDQAPVGKAVDQTPVEQAPVGQTEELFGRDVSKVESADLTKLEPGSLAGKGVLGIQFADIKRLTNSFDTWYHGAAKLDPKSPRYIKGKSERTRFEETRWKVAQKTLNDELTLKWAPEVRPLIQKLLHQVDAIARRDGEYKDLAATRIDKIRALRAAKKEVDDAVRLGRDANAIQGLEASVQAARKALSSAGDELDTRRAFFLYRALRYLQGDKSVMRFSEADAAALRKIDHDIDLLKRRKEFRGGDEAAAQYDHKGGLGSIGSVEEFESGSVDQIIKSIDELEEEKLDIITRQLARDAGDVVDPPSGVLGSVEDYNTIWDSIEGPSLASKLFDKNRGPWVKAVHNKARALANRFYRREIENVQSAKRDLKTSDTVLKAGYPLSRLPEAIRGKWARVGNGKAVYPKLEIDGVEVIRSGGKAFRDSMQKHITDADRAAAKAADSDISKLDFDVEVGTDGFERFVPKIREAHLKVWNEQSDPAYVAFDRLFKEKNGQTLKEAIKERELIEGNYITHIVSGQKITKSEFPEWAIKPENLESLAVGTGVRIPWDTANATPLRSLAANSKKYVKETKTKGKTNNPEMSYDSYKKMRLDEARKKGERVKVGDIRNEWVRHVESWLDEVLYGTSKDPQAMHTQMRGVYESLFRKELKVRRAKLNTHRNPHSVHLTDSDEQLAWAKAMEKAKREVSAELNRSNGSIRKALVDPDPLNFSKPLKEAPPASAAPAVKAASKADETPVETSLDDIQQSAEESFKASEDLMKMEFKYNEKALREEMDKALKEGRATRELKEKKLNELREEWKAERAKLRKAYDESVAARKEMHDRLQEQLIMHAAHNAGEYGQTAIRVSFAGKKIFDANLPDKMIQSVQHFSKAGLVGKATNAWAEAFSPASKLPRELNLMRLRTQARVPEIIKHHTDELHNKFYKITPKRRQAAFEAMRKGGTPTDVTRALEAEFDEIAKYFGKDGPKVGGEPLSVGEINGFLPEKFRLETLPGKHTNTIVITNGKDLLQHMRKLDKNTDPMKVLWSYRIAAEQALATKGIKKNIIDMFGVARQVPKQKGRKAGEWTEKGRQIERLNKEQGWVTLDRVSKDHYFPPDVADDVNKILDMMKAENVEGFTRFYDKITRSWKATVTIYNPGYYVRNGIGETFMLALQGMKATDARVATKAARVLSAKQPDSVRQAIKTLDPLDKTSVGKSPELEKILKIGNGDELTIDQVWYLYNEQGLKTGFVSTEYDQMFPAAGSLRASVPGQLAHKANDAVRNMGESYEDYFRLTSFMYQMSKVKGAAGKTASQIAEEAAAVTRKYHFDYTDFTPFEKSKMLRLFPFYKWTRKALPLMAGMVFTKPGLVTAYPKFMQNASYAVGGYSPLEDENGHLPNYEEFTPDWVKGLMAYPMGVDQEGNTTYSNIATPALDIYKMAQDPVSTLVGMLNPWLKVPLEQGIGRQIDPNFQLPLEGQRNQHLLRQTPITNLLRKHDREDSLTSEPGALMDETLFSFLSGLGNYEVKGS